MSAQRQNSDMKHLALDDVMKNVYAIDRDCKNEEFMHKTIDELNDVIALHNANNKKEMALRNKLLDHIYDIYEFINFYDKRSRFEVLKRMVKNVKSNDGSFDLDPLNIAARRIYYFMKSIPADERYKLVLEIKRKTKNTSTYNYDEQIKDLSKEYQAFKREQKYLQLEADLERYEEIRAQLQEEPDNKTQIALYNELLPLVNKQPSWGRGRKFAEKKTIYNHLSVLYRKEGMMEKAFEAEAKREQFRKAMDNANEATRLKYPDKYYKWGRE